MTVGGHRSERIAEEVRNEVSLMLAGELKDPRLAAPLIVSEVRMSPDLRTARVYVRLLGEEADRAKTLAGLKAASGFVRHELVERLQLRRAPEVIFIADESEEYGEHIDQLLRSVSGPKTAAQTPSTASSTAPSKDPEQP
jgi:ribosome-binding factor A